MKIKEENWDGTYKNKLFEQIYGRKCDYSPSDCAKMGSIQKTFNLLISDLVKVNPEAAKAVAELTGSMPLILK